MSLDEILLKMRGMFSDVNRNRKRRRSSNCVDSGPPPKHIKNVQEHRFARDEAALRTHPVKKSFLRSMGSIGSMLSRFKPSQPACEPTECEEYSDGEDVIVNLKFRKSDLEAPTRFQPMSNYQLDKMSALNNRSSANRPPPPLIPKSKWSRVPDLQKVVPLRPPRVNGYQYENDTSSTTRTHLVNGHNLSFKGHSGQHFENNVEKQFSNYFNSAHSAVNVRRCDNFVSKCPSLNSIKTQQNAEEKLRFERLLKSIIPDYGQSVPDPLPTSKRPSIVQNHVSARPPIRTSENHTLDDDFYKKQEEAIQRFSEASIDRERKVTATTPINSIRLKLESEQVFKPSYTATVKEKYSPAILQRADKISQHEETSSKINSMRVRHCGSYEKLSSDWHTPSIVVLDEDIEEKVDDFPELTDNQKQTIRHAMSGNPNQVLISKFNIQITRSHIYTLQWEPLAWLNDEVINFYMNLLTERGELRSGDGYPKVYAMNTFFTQRLFAGGHAAVKRWTKKVDLFACDIIPVPVHVGNVHWCMAIINMKEKTIKYYDSMGAPNQRVLSELEDYLRKESLDKRKIEFDMSDWSKENVTDNPRQENGSDCGVFSCITAEFICRNRPIVFTQQHMNYFRQRMVLEICSGKLLL